MLIKSAPRPTAKVSVACLVQLTGNPLDLFNMLNTSNTECSRYPPPKKSVTSALRPQIRRIFTDIMGAGCDGGLFWHFSSRPRGGVLLLCIAYNNRVFVHCTIYTTYCVPDITEAPPP